VATSGSRARRILLGAAALTVMTWLTPAIASAEPCTSPGIPLGCDPTETTTTVGDTTTTILDTTTTVEETTTTQARPSTTTTRPASRPTTTTIVEVEITTTTLGVTTSTNLLVPGDGTEGAESTTTTEAAVAISSTDDGPSDGTLIGIVVVGLVLIAVAVGVLTWRYWLATRPLPVEGEGRPAPAG
jgi:hypothetical protein